ncbi:MAG: aldehyde dehydrogenase [Nitrososphaerales archaeon]|jgi:aldehyde dehydrogenase (NAD+)
MQTLATNEVRQYKNYVNGEWVDASDGSTLEVVNPFTGLVWARVPDSGPGDIDKAVKSSQKAFESTWSDMMPGERGRLLNRFADSIETEAEVIATADTESNGKLIREMLGQMKSIPNWFRYFAGVADKVFGEVIPLEKPNMLNYTIREPLGPIAIVVPWNSPILVISYSMAPALAVGNTVVLKPSRYAPVSTLEFMRAVHKAGFPPGVVNTVTGSGEKAGNALVKHPLVKRIVFTGGSQIGKTIARMAAENLTGTTLELGGKSPNIIFEDANLDNAINGILAGIFAACGQTCVAGSRVFIQDSIFDRVVSRLIERTKEIKMGNPLSPDTEYGPIANKEQLEKVERYVEIAKSEGAKLLYGGTKPSSRELRNGFFFAPTIFKATNGMRVAQEEIFGPVLCVIPFTSDEEVIRMANDTEFGLAAGVWTNDLARAHRIAKRLQAGTVWINTYRAISFASPFGGYKASGYGRENGLEAIHEFTQVKSVMIDTSGKMGDPFILR